MKPMRLVLDTNVVIDWLVFDHPFMRPLRVGITAGNIVVLTHEPATNELLRVLGYRQLKLDAARQADVFTRYCEQTTMFAMPAFEREFGSSLAVSVGSESWASSLRSALRDPRSFSARALATSDV